MAKEEKQKDAKVKRPTALKRDLRNEKQRLVNKSFKSNVRTTLRAFEKALTEKSNDLQVRLSALYSAMDKGVKRGVFKPNHAARIKSRCTQRVGKLQS